MNHRSFGDRGAGFASQGMPPEPVPFGYADGREDYFHRGREGGPDESSRYQWTHGRYMGFLNEGPAEGGAARGPRGYKRSDDRIGEDVHERLAQLEHLDLSDVEVRVSEGEVTLSGTVDSTRTKHMAEDVAASVRGVVDVVNTIRVRRG